MLGGTGNNQEQNEALLLAHLFFKHASELWRPKMFLKRGKKLKSWKPAPLSQKKKTIL